MSKQARLAGLMLIGSAFLFGATPTTKPVESGTATASPSKPVKAKPTAKPEARPTSQPVAAAMKAATANFESVILAYEKADLSAPPAPGGVVFYGSSSIRMWKTLKEDFPALNVINRGFGGSTAPDALKYMSRVVLPYRPSTIVFYEGDNDLSKGRTPEQLLADCQTFAKEVHATLPTTRILFLSVKPSVKRSTIFDKQATANSLLSTWITKSKDPRLVYVDIVKPMMDASGAVRPDLFLADRLHMNREGYKIWAKTITSLLHPSKIVTAEKTETPAN
jgi:lysophospholipase L1-like esterase